MNNTLGKYQIPNDTFNLASSVIICTIAITGNSVVILVLAKPIFRKEPIFRYLLISTIFDTLNAMMIIPSTHSGLFLINQLNWRCKFYYYISDSMNTFCGWMNVLISIDTLMTVKYPTKFRFRKNFNYQIFVILSFFCLSFLINLADFFYLGIQREICTGLSFEISFFLNLYLLIIYLLIPFTIITITSSITYFHLKKTQMKQNNLKKSKNLFKVSLVLNLMFFISNFPPYIVCLIYNFLNILIHEPLYNSIQVLSYLYYSCDFFIYFVTNKRFRENFLFYFQRKKRVLLRNLIIHNRNKISPIA